MTGSRKLTARLMWRKTLNVVMLSLTGVAALGVVSILFMILGYLIYNGGHSLKLELLHAAAEACR